MAVDRGDRDVRAKGHTKVDVSVTVVLVVARKLDTKWIIATLKLICKLEPVIGCHVRKAKLHHVLALRISRLQGLKIPVGVCRTQDHGSGPVK